MLEGVIGVDEKAHTTNKICSGGHIPNAADQSICRTLHVLTTLVHVTTSTRRQVLLIQRYKVCVTTRMLSRLYTYCVMFLLQVYRNKKDCRWHPKPLAPRHSSSGRTNNTGTPVCCLRVHVPTCLSSNSCMDYFAC